MSSESLDDLEREGFSGDVDFTTFAAAFAAVPRRDATDDGLKWRRNDNGITAGRAIHTQSTEREFFVL